MGSNMAGLFILNDLFIYLGKTRMGIEDNDSRQITGFLTILVSRRNQTLFELISFLVFERVQPHMSSNHTEDWGIVLIIV